MWGARARIWRTGICAARVSLSWRATGGRLRAAANWIWSPGREQNWCSLKTRVSGAWNAPERDIDVEKMQALRRTAKTYLRRAGLESVETRFDVISIEGRTLEHYRHAFPFTLSV
jgi:Holliday junction resolvase-like predicted endonuclease